ncbi:hypothetical protein GT347_18100 [Xylophilus rhododendri]|uniref:Uncharacterized protein n=1 Tax=Xylophilus rhododendri TaxID=2697032 RepID=A0A857J6T5_9BURK|nr:HrpB1 family type III secretion system apparatus protein [Xylophilus rhododendri]QHI99720.1 hypothetical protein GT347_18100 [Xylophilus rhododendri]
MSSGADAARARDVVRMFGALREHRLDEAEQLFAELGDADSRVKNLRVFPVLLAIQRGRPLDALQFVNSLPGDPCPELRALCLRLLGDPRWQGEAATLLDSSDPEVGKAMRELLADTPLA